MFTFYWIMLIVGGVLMLGLGLGGGGLHLSNGSRALNVILGLGFVGYGLYLGFAFHGGHYLIFYYVFILPILMLFRAFSGANRTGAQQPNQPPRPAPLTYPQPQQPINLPPMQQNPFGNPPPQPPSQPYPQQAQPFPGAEQA